MADKKKIASISRDFLKRLKRFESLKKPLNDRLLALSGRITAKGPFLRQTCFSCWRLLLKKFGTTGAYSALCGDRRQPFEKLDRRHCIRFSRCPIHERWSRCGNKV